jgi:hypothetical protein
MRNRHRLTSVRMTNHIASQIEMRNHHELTLSLMTILFRHSLMTLNFQQKKSGLKKFESYKDRTSHLIKQCWVKAVSQRRSHGPQSEAAAFTSTCVNILLESYKILS